MSEIKTEECVDRDEIKHNTEDYLVSIESNNSSVDIDSVIQVDENDIKLESEINQNRQQKRASKNYKKYERKKRSKNKKKESTELKEEKLESFQADTFLDNVVDIDLPKEFDCFKLPSSMHNDDESKDSNLSKPIVPAGTIDEEEDEEDEKPMSRKKWKLLYRISVGQLKVKVRDPGLVETYDNCSRDPMFLIELKGARNTVPVPVHWCHVGRYLQSKRGFCKPPFQLPEYLVNTGIMEIRPTHGIETKSLKQKMKEKIRPKVGMVDLDYQKLHDAFFKNQTKPKYSVFGDVYFQGKEVKFESKEMRPGYLSDKLREALGIPLGKEGDRIPPPYLIHQQRYGPPPSWPKLKIPGLNAPLPPGASYGYHRDGWGKPPVDENNQPIYGDAFDNAFVKYADRYYFNEDEEEEEEDGKYWGEPDSSDDEEDEDSSNNDESEVKRSLEVEDYVRERRQNRRDHSDEGEVSDNDEPVRQNVNRTVPPPIKHDNRSSSVRRSEAEIEFEAIKAKYSSSSGQNKRDLYKVLQQKRNSIGDNLVGSNRVYDLEGVQSSNSDKNSSTIGTKRKFEITSEEKRIKSKKHKFKF